MCNYVTKFQILPTAKNFKLKDKDFKKMTFPLKIRILSGLQNSKIKSLCGLANAACL